MAASSAELTKLVNHIDGLDQSSFPDEDERHIAITKARQLVARLEKPWDTLLYINWNMLTVIVSLKACIDLGIFNVLDADGGVPKTSKHIATTVGSEEVVVIRMMRHLAANNLIVEAGPSTFGATPVTREISQGLGSSAVDFTYDFGFHAALTLPEYLQKTKYQNPTDVRDGNFQVAMKTAMPMFGPDSYLMAHPDAAKRFSNLMVGYTSQRQNWVEIFPTEQLLDGLGGDTDVAIVDVGGNAGEDLAHFVKKHPEAKDRVVVQDLGPIIAAANIPAGIKPMAHDFFTAQPVQKANAYFLHSILHDWPDSDCLRILKHLRAAFGPKSRLLINEHVIQPTGAPQHQTALDVLMMVLLSSTERSKDMWSELLGKAGFKIVNVHQGRLESLIEAVPA